MAREGGVTLCKNCGTSTRQTNFLLVRFITVDIQLLHLFQGFSQDFETISHYCRKLFFSNYE